MIADLVQEVTAHFNLNVAKAEPVEDSYSSAEKGHHGRGNT